MRMRAVMHFRMLWSGAISRQDSADKRVLGESKKERQNHAQKVGGGGTMSVFVAVVMVMAALVRSCVACCERD